MPRRVQSAKKKEPDTVDSKSMVVVTGTKSQLMEIYSKNVEIAKLGAIELRKSDKKELRSVDELAQSLTAEQVAYLNMRADGMMSRQICPAIGVKRTVVLLWEEIALFKACANVIKRMEADDAEELLWQIAGSNPKAGAERMGALKARKPEYQESNNGTGIAQPRVELFIVSATGEKMFDISENYKNAGSDD